MRVAVLAGGVGAARLLRGMVQVVDASCLSAIVNVGDDDQLHGLNISPDLDTITYTVAGQIDPGRGWGLANETWRAFDRLRQYAVANDRADEVWFQLGDHDLGTHLYRTGRLRDGVPLSQVTAEIARRWELPLTLLPVTDDPLTTRLVTVDGRELSFQEYFVREQHQVAISEVRFVGAETARPAPGVIDALLEADRVVIAPSNPIISLGPLLAVPGLRALLADRREDVVAVSPIVGGRALKGPADRLMTELGGEATASGVAALYSSLAATLVVDQIDAELADGVRAHQMEPVVTDTIMSDPDAAARLSRVVLGLPR